MSNPLKIQEPKLLEFHNQVAECFIENNIPFEAQYQREPSSNFNSVVHYLVQTNQPRAGFICVNNSIFGGVVSKNEQIKYLLKEGFELDPIFNEEPIYASAPCVLAFVCMLAIDRIKDLVFSEELEEEFNQVTSLKWLNPNLI